MAENQENENVEIRRDRNKTTINSRKSINN